MSCRRFSSLGLAALLLGAAPVALHAEVQPMALVQPITDYKIYVARSLAELVEEKNGVKITVKPFPGGVLGPDLQTVSAMQGGTIDLTALTASLLAGVLPAWRAMQITPAIQLKTQ